MKHLSILTGIENPTKKLIKNYWSMTTPKSTSINVFTDNVYNILEGYSLDVIENQTSKGTRYIVTMKISNDLIVRYLNLKELYVPSRSAVEAGFLLGKADKFVGIECCTRVRSAYPVRIGARTYYNENPEEFLLNDYEPELHTRTFYTVWSTHFEVVDDSLY
jgi:hypothetical protein